MKVVRGQEANLKSSKRFYGGSKSNLKAGAGFSNIHARNHENHENQAKSINTMKTYENHENLWKSMKINENL